MDTATRQRAIRAIALAALLAVVVVGSGIAGDRLSVHLSNLVQVVAPFGAAVGCWSASGRAVLAAERRAWRFFGASATAWCGGQVVWTTYELTGIAAPFPSVADVGYLLAIPLALAGAWSLAMRSSTSTRLVALVDGLIIAGSLLAIAWPLVLAPS
jgi:diguanylate cyclase